MSQNLNILIHDLVLLTNQSDDLPSITTSDGSQIWINRGVIHRDCGPAVIFANGHLEWWYDDNEITDVMNKWCAAREIDLNNLSEYDKQEIKIYMASL